MQSQSSTTLLDFCHPMSASSIPTDANQSGATRYHATRLLTSHARLAVFPPMQIKVAPCYSTSDIPCSASSVPTDANQSSATRYHATRLLASHPRLAMFPPIQIKAEPRYSASDMPCSASSVPTMTRPACREALPRSRGPAGRQATFHIQKIQRFNALSPYG